MTAAKPTSDDPREVSHSTPETVQPAPASGRGAYLWPWISTACWKVGRLTQGISGWVIPPTALKPILSCSTWVWPP